MPIYEITAPNGKSYEIEGPEGATQDQVIGAVLSQFPDAANAAAAPQEATFGSALKGGFESLASQTRTGAGALLGDASEAATEGLQRSEGIAQDVGTMGSLQRIKDTYNDPNGGLLAAAGQAVKDIPAMLGSQGATLGAMGVGARLGAMAGAPFAGVGAIPGAVIGGALGAGASLFPQQFGQNLEAQAAAQQEAGQPVEVSPGAAAAGAAGQVIAEGAGAAFTFGGSLIGRIIGTTGSKTSQSAKLLEVAQRSLAGTVGRGAVRGAAAEMPTEVAQQVIQRAQAGQDILSDDALAEYGEAAYAGGLTGGVLGGGTSPMNRSAARTQLTEGGVDPSTGQAISTPEIDAEREAILRAEQAPPDLGRQTREQARQAVVDSYTTPVNRNRDIDDLQAELDELQESGIDSPQRRGRMRDIKQAINAQREAQLAPIVEPARRARQNAEDMAATPPAIPAEDAASTFIRDEISKADPSVVLAERNRLRASESRTPEESLWLRVANDELKVQRARQRDQGAEAIRRAQENRDVRDQLLPQFNAEESASVFQPVEPVITREALLRTGLPPRAGYTKKLEGLDLRDPEQLKTAQGIVREVMANNTVKPETKERMQALLARREYAEAGIGNIPEVDATLAQKPEPITVETAPLKFGDEAFTAMGIGRTANVRKAPEINSLDAADPQQRDMMLRTLEALSEDKHRSVASADKIRQYMDRIRATYEGAQNEGLNDGTNLTVPTDRSGGNGAGVAVAARSGQNVPGNNPASASDPSVAELGRLGDAIGSANKPNATQINTDPALTRQQARRGDIDPDTEIAAQEARERAFARDRQARYGDYDKDIMFVATGAYQEGQNAGDVPGYSTPELQAALEAKDTTASLSVIRDSEFGYNQMEQLVAKRILDTGNRMPSIEMVDALPATPDGLAPSGQYNAVTDTISLVRGQADSHTFLHEVVHAFTHRFITRQAERGYTSPHAKGLVDLYAHVKRMKPDLESYGMSNVSEFIAEAMSNRYFQMELMGIPYRKQTVWGWFSRAVGRLMGITPSNPVDNALFAAVVHVDGLMNPGRRMQLDENGTPVVNPIVNAVRTQLTPSAQLTPDDLLAVRMAQPQNKKTLKAYLKNMRESQEGPSMLTRIRVQAVDQFASVAEKMDAVYTNGVRNAMGNVNPMHFLRQAVDSQRVAVRFFMEGGLRRNSDGFWETYRVTDEAGNEQSARAVVNQIQEFGKKYGMDYETAKARVSTLLEGMRLNSMREFNAEQEALAQAYEMKNTKEDDERADQARDKKKRLHMTNAEIDALVATFQNYPEVLGIQNTLNATRSNAIDAMIAAGRLSKEHGQFWKDNVDYVPFDRMEGAFAASSLTQYQGRQGIAMLGTLKDIKGSYVREVSNTVDNSMNKLSWMVGQTMRNDAAVRVLQEMTKAGYAKKLDAPSLAKENKLVVPKLYIDGKPAYFELENEYDLAAFTQAKEPSSGIINGAATVARILRGTITSMPTFALNQVVQDTTRVAILSGTKSSTRTAVRTLVNFPATWVRSLVGKEAPISQEMHGVGVVGNYDYNPVDPLSALEHETGAVRLNPMQSMLHRLEQVAKASDMAARQAVYEQTMLETGDKALAQVRARELINFNRRGASGGMRVLTKIVPFFNAYVQGTDLMLRGITGKDSSTGFGKAQARKYIASRMAMLTAMGFAYAASMSDDEDYENADEYVRQRGWIIPKSVSSMFDGADGRHTPLVLPVAKEFAFLFKTIPEMVIQHQKESAAGENKDATEVGLDLLRTAFASYVMAPVPTVIKPALENLTNYSFFTGRPLVPERMKNAPKPTQVASNTSEVARTLGAATDMSPILIDNFLRGTFGLAGSMAVAGVDAALNPNLPEKPMDKIPGLSTFTTSEVGTRATSEFYEFREKVDQAVQGVKAYEDDPVQLEAFIRKNGHLLAAKDWAKEKTDALSEIRKAREIYMRSDALNITPAERRARLLELEKIQRDILGDTRRMRRIVGDLKQE